jgi:hypothetical protein
MKGMKGMIEKQLSLKSRLLFIVSYLSLLNLPETDLVLSQPVDRSSLCAEYCVLRAYFFKLSPALIMSNTHGIP